MRKLLTITAAACAALLVAAPVSAGEEEDQAIAEDVVAEAANLVPDGYEEEPPSDDDEETQQPEQPPECDDIIKVVDDAEEGPFAEATYGDSADPIGLTEVTASVYVFPKAKQAKKFANKLTSTSALECSQAGADMLGGGTVEEIAFNNAEGYQATVESNSFVLLIQQVRVRVGRAVLSVVTASEAEPLPFIEDFTAGLEEALAEEV